MKSPRTWIAATSVLAVLVIAVVDLRRPSPGPLSSVHAGLPELAGRDGCSNCHGGWTTSMTSACLECHDTIEAHLALNEGLHGRMRETTAEACGDCHGEHHGEGFVTVNLQSFARAGIPHPDRFDHSMLDWKMDGAHLELDCAECHTNADKRLIPPGERRYLGLDRDCASCHEDPHEGRMAVSCATCHGQSDFTELRSLGHEKILPLEGGHADVSCRTCHGDDDLHSLEALGRRNSKLKQRDCRDCHEDPHSSEFVDGIAEIVERAAGASCITCHVTEHETFRADDLAVAPELHAQSGFSLDFPHDQVDCDQCHSPTEAAFAEKYPGRSQDKCSSCHEDPHGGQFAKGPFSDGDCLACHEPKAFDPHTFGAEEHSRASLQLDGAHLALACEECHERESNLPRVFRGTPSDCDGCHGDAHEGFFASHAAELDTVEHGICASCHGTESFSDLPDGGFDHHRYAEFHIDGAHAQASCESCHTPAKTPDPFGRKFGRIVENYGRVEGCITCHADPHGGEFDQPGLPKLIEERAGCARCHTTSSFRALVADWDHRRWTRFSLKGQHSLLGCSDCHEPTRIPDELGRTWERAAGDRCADCHSNPHGDQFEVRGSTSCERCHETSEAWSQLDFNHDRDTSFLLGAAHNEVACSKCHRPWDPENEQSAVRYRPLEKDCVSCHGTHEGPSLKRTGK